MRVDSTTLIVGINECHLDKQNLPDFNQDRYAAEGIKYWREWLHLKFKEFEIEAFQANYDEPIIIGRELTTMKDQVRSLCLRQGPTQDFTTGVQALSQQFFAIFGYYPDIFILQNAPPLKTVK